MTIDQAGGLLLLAVAVSLVSRKLKIPYTVGLTVAGFALAFSPISIDLKLTKELIFSVLLPPLIFEAAHQICWDELKNDLGVITLLATVGVFLSVGVIAGGLHLIVGADWNMCLMLGVLLSATDPVAVIATFKDAQVTGRLRLLVEAESLFNDGTAAVLFGIALAATSGSQLGWGSSIANFVVTVFGGVAIGGLVGALTLFVAGQTDDHLLEASLTTLAAYAAFIVSEHFHVSGVLGTLTAGILLGNLGSLGSISDESRDLLIFYWEYVAFLANSLIFLLIGIRLAHRSFLPYTGPVSAVIVLTLMARAVGVYLPLAILSRSKTRVDLRHQHILVWGGLRGALALALALGLPEDIPWREQALTLTFGVVAFSVIVQGLTVTPLMKGLGLNDRPQEQFERNAENSAQTRA